MTPDRLLGPWRGSCEKTKRRGQLGALGREDWWTTLDHGRPPSLGSHECYGHWHEQGLLGIRGMGAGVLPPGVGHLQPAVPKLSSWVSCSSILRFSSGGAS